MKNRELTPLQSAFLDALFDPANKGDFKKAMQVAGYGKTTPVHVVVQPLAELIIERAEQMLALAAPKATLVMIGMLDDELSPNEKAKMFATKEILDRVGIIKKEKVDVNLKGAGGIFILPAQEEVTPDEEE